MSPFFIWLFLLTYLLISTHYIIVDPRGGDGGHSIGEAVPLYLVEAWYKARGETPYFEVRRCTLKELVDHQRAQGDKCVLFPSPPVFPVEYKWWNPEKGVHQEVVLDQPIEYFQWYGHTDFVRTADGQMHYEEKDAY